MPRQALCHGRVVTIEGRAKGARSGRPRVLMACLHYWGSPLQVGSQHLARCFVDAGWDVGFFSAPITPLHLLKGLRDNLPERFAIWRRRGVSDCDGRLRAYVPLALLAPDNRPGLRLRRVLEHWPRLTFPSVTAMAHAWGFGEPDLLYLDNFYHAFWLRRVRARRSVYRMTDVNAAFPGSTPGLQAAEARLVATVDLVVYPAQGMAAHVAALGARRMEYVPNGIDVRQYRPCNRPLPREYLSIPAPRALYVGVIERWFDAQLLAAAAEALPGVSFVLVGPVLRECRALRSLANVFMVGPRGRDHVPALLEHAQLGLIPFDVRNYGDLVSVLRPLKLLEYLAAGLPVVSTAWAELRLMNSPATLCDTREEFIRAVADHAFAPSGEVACYQDFAARHDWKQSFATLTGALAF